MARRKVKVEMAAADEGLKKSPLRHDKNGHEMLDPTPMQPPLGYKRTPTLSEQIAQQVRQMKMEIALGDSDIEETEEEADDFEVGDDFEPLSAYENDHIPPIAVMKAHVKHINNLIEEENRKNLIKAHENALKKPEGVTTPAAQPTPDKNTPT